MDHIEHQLNQHKKYKVKRLNNRDLVVNMVVGDRKVTLIITGNPREFQADVLVVDNLHPSFISRRRLARQMTIPRSYRSLEASMRVYDSYSSLEERVLRKQPVIIAGCHADLKYNLDELREAELDGKKIFNRKMGNKLANDTGAVKYIEYSTKNGKGLKNLVDEIAYAGLGELQDEIELKSKLKSCDIL